ncbi:NUDIX hydrolase [Ralstonia flaminis]|jgi:8-oxo-dGTP diphosphatase|nr:NUDIX hydrolase [Ralstonia sp. LMG 18101]
MTVLDARSTPAAQQLVSDTFHFAASERRFFYVHRHGSPTMKERATVLCKRGDRILLVARPSAHWVLPGGKPHRGETLGDAARRELAEETGIVCRDVRPLFQFAGGNKHHHVFVADIEASAIARPAEEIAHCAWFDRQAIASIDCSRPTPLIVKRALKVLDNERYVMAYMEAMLLQAAA